MPEKRKRMVPIRVTYICDECGEGEMVPGNIMYLTDPPITPYKCNKCGWEKEFQEKNYPYIEYIEEE